MSLINFHAELHTTNELLSRIATALETIAQNYQPSGDLGYHPPRKISEEDFRVASYVSPPKGSMYERTLDRAEEARKLAQVANRAEEKLWQAHENLFARTTERLRDAEKEEESPNPDAHQAAQETLEPRKDPIL